MKLNSLIQRFSLEIQKMKKKKSSRKKSFFQWRKTNQKFIVFDLVCESEEKYFWFKVFGFGFGFGQKSDKDFQWVCARSCLSSFACNSSLIYSDQLERYRDRQFADRLERNFCEQKRRRVTRASFIRISFVIFMLPLAAAGIKLYRRLFNRIMW